MRRAVAVAAAFVVGGWPGDAQGQPAAPTGLVTREWGGSGATRCVPDVDAAIRALPEHGVPLFFEAEGEGSFHWISRHWQGIQRLPAGREEWFVLTRSGGAAGFVVVRRDSGAVGRIVARALPEPGLDHPGGIQAAGRHLAVAFESGGDSAAVILYDLSAPLQPRRLGVAHDSRGPVLAQPGRASLAALARLADGRWLLAVGARSSKALAFYRSVDSTLGPDPRFAPLSVSVEGVEGGFQNVNLVTQCDGTLFVVGMHNTGFPPPSLGHDHLHWYAFEAAPSRGLRLALRGDRGVTCEQCNFGAAAGLFVSAEGELALYGTGRGLGGPDGTVPVEEFARTAAGR